jgi:hypothetical protein
MRTLLAALLKLYILLQSTCQDVVSWEDISVTRDTIPLIAKSGTSTIEKNNRLIAFVGEKISVQPLPPEPESMDASFLAKYKVLVNVYGNYPRNTI